MVEFPAEVFRHRLLTQLVKHVRPPTRRDLGTKVLKLKPVVVPAILLNEMLSTLEPLGRSQVAARPSLPEEPSLPNRLDGEPRDDHRGQGDAEADEQSYGAAMRTDCCTDGGFVASAAHAWSPSAQLMAYTYLLMADFRFCADCCVPARHE